MNQQTVERIGTIGGIAAIAGAFLLHPPLNDWAKDMIVAWVAGSVAYKSAMASKKTDSELHAKVLLVSVCLGGLTMLLSGAPSADFDGVAGVGVWSFLRLFVGARVGVFLAVSVGRPFAPRDGTSGSSPPP